MVSSSDVLLTLGCVWSASTGHAPAHDTQHVDLWWQPAPSITEARAACLEARLCTGIYWNDRDRVFKMLGGAVTSHAAPPSLHASHYSVHTHACSVDNFRAQLRKSRHNVVFVVTTVPRTRLGARNRDGTSYFSTHLRSLLSQVGADKTAHIVQSITAAAAAQICA